MYSLVKSTIQSCSQYQRRYGNLGVTAYHPTRFVTHWCKAPYTGCMVGVSQPWSMCVQSWLFVLGLAQGYLEVRDGKPALRATVKFKLTMVGNLPHSLMLSSLALPHQFLSSIMQPSMTFDQSRFFLFLPKYSKNWFSILSSLAFWTSTMTANLAFAHKSSSATALISLHDKVNRLLDQVNVDVVQIISYDFERAFDNLATT